MLFIIHAYVSHLNGVGHAAVRLLAHSPDFLQAEGESCNCEKDSQKQLHALIKHD